MVEEVKECCGKRQAGTLCNGNLLRQTHIKVPRLKTPERAAARGLVHAQLNGPKLVTHSLRVGEYVKTTSATAGTGPATTGRSDGKAPGSCTSGGNPDRLGNCADPIGDESGVIVGLGQARPIEEVGKLCSRIRGRTDLECRLDPVEHVPHALVGYITGKLGCHPGRTARLTLADAASGQYRFEE